MFPYLSYERILLWKCHFFSYESFWKFPFSN